MKSSYSIAGVFISAVILTACSGSNQSPALTPTLGAHSPVHRVKSNASGCTTIQDSTGATYTVAHVGGGNPVDVEYSATPCQIGIYINGTNGPNTLDSTTVNGPFAIGIYFDNAGNNAREDHTQICVNGSNSTGGCLSGTATSPGTGLDIRNTPKFSADHTSIDSYTAGFATNPCPNSANNMTVDHTVVTNARYPWSYEGGNNNFNFLAGHDSPPFQGNSCAGSGVGIGGIGATLWVVNSTAPANNVVSFSPPLNDSSSPTLTLTNSAWGPPSPITSGHLAFDSGGNLYVGVEVNSGIGSVDIFTPPFSNSSLPSATITNGLGNAPQGLAFDSSGRLFVANPGPTEFSLTYMLVYDPPFSNSSSPSFTFSSGGNQCGPIAFDSRGDLYTGCGDGTEAIEVFAPPFTSLSSPVATITNGIAAPNGIALDPSGKLYVANTGANAVSIYDPPFTNSSSPAFTITNGIEAPYDVALDAGGDLYVSEEPYGKVLIFTPPLSNSSSPVVTITNGVPDPNGLLIQNMNPLAKKIHSKHRTTY